MPRTAGASSVSSSTTSGSCLSAPYNRDSWDSGTPEAEESPVPSSASDFQKAHATGNRQSSSSPQIHFRGRKFAVHTHKSVDRPCELLKLLYGKYRSTR